ncbi:hypothetical protein BwiPL1_54340 (plasmid) [Bacillus wiedmannii]|nr:hypothetical protein BwiPL1_54340 [Bacillus wiedmannii]
MSTDRLFLHALRKEDFLNLTFELVNIHTEGSPQQLVRSSDQPPLLIVHFAPQHIVEEAFQNDPGPSPAQAMVAGPSRLVFKLPENPETWPLPLTLKTLLNWRDYSPVLADNALPPGAQYGPGLIPPSPEQTVLEIPTGFYLSPDNLGWWKHSIPPVEYNQRIELWQTRLISKESGNEDGTARIIWTPNSFIPFTNALDQQKRNEIGTLSSDFSLPKMPKYVNSFQTYFDWRKECKNNHLPFPYIPGSIHLKRLMLSSMGAWMNLESSWDYPTINKATEKLGYPILSLVEWQHITAQGRDQYVKTVQKWYVYPFGHIANLIQITDRTFASAAFLRQYCKISFQETVKDYGALSEVYNNSGREMIFKRIHIKTIVTPEIECPNPNQPQTSFWAMEKNNQPFLFQIEAEDYEGNLVHFECPLLFVPLSQSNWDEVRVKYEENNIINIQSQSISFAEADSASKGNTSLKTNQIIFDVQIIDENKMLTFHTGPFLPCMKSARVSLPAVEKLLGSHPPVNVCLDDVYLHNGFNNNNKGEVFARLADASGLPLPFPAEKAGGLIKPDITIDGLSRLIGPVANLSSIKDGKFNPSMFMNTHFLGSIPLDQILAPDVGFDPSGIKETMNQDIDKLKDKLLNDPTLQVKVPMITSRVLPPGIDPTKEKVTAIETVFFWKPVLTDYNGGFLNLKTKKEDTRFENDAQLVVHAHTVTPTSIDTPSDPQFEVTGQLTDFALEFVESLVLKFESLIFCAQKGKKVDVRAKGMDIEFKGALNFVNTLKDILPSDGFDDPPNLTVSASGVSAGYTLGVPNIGVGVFNLQNISLSASLSLPFVDQPAGVRFSISERHKPFLVSVGFFGGGGFFSLALNANGIEQMEASIEFGGNFSLNLGVASGGASVMAGIYFSMAGHNVKLTGYFRCNGYLSVLGLISVSVEFYLGFTFNDKSNQNDPNDHRGEVWGQASVTVGVKVAFFSKSITLTVERKFAGPGGDPTFEQMVGLKDWEEYCCAFA